MNLEEWLDYYQGPTVNTMEQMTARIREAQPHLLDSIRCRVVLGNKPTLIVPVSYVSNFAKIRGVNVQGDFLLDEDPDHNSIWLQPSGMFTLNKHVSDI